MALYDLSNQLHAAQFRQRADKLLETQAVVDLTEKKPRRTTQQNRYLHTLLGYLAVEVGESLEWVKREYYKKLINADVFIAEKHDAVMNKQVKFLRSSAALATDEMTLTIERLRNWASKELGIYLPSADEHRMLQLMEVEIDRNKVYV